MSGVYLIFSKQKILDLGTNGFVVSDAAITGDWEDCREGARWKAKFNSKWHKLALDMSKWFNDNGSGEGCTEKNWKRKVVDVNKEYGHRAAQEFVAVLPRDSVVGKPPGKIHKVLMAMGNKRQDGGDIDISSFIS